MKLSSALGLDKTNLRGRRSVALSAISMRRTTREGTRDLQTRIRADGQQTIQVIEKHRVKSSISHLNTRAAGLTKEHNNAIHSVETYEKGKEKR